MEGEVEEPTTVLVAVGEGVTVYDGCPSVEIGVGERS